MHAIDAEERFIAQSVARIDEVPARDLARGARNLAQVAASNLERAELLSGKPTAHVKVDQLDELVEAMERELWLNADRR